jgi:hypothetical protein
MSSIYDVAIGDVSQEAAGSASGALSAVQQLAAAIGSAVVTTIYFGEQARHGAARAMTVSVAVVGASVSDASASSGSYPNRHDQTNTSR